MNEDELDLDETEGDEPELINSCPECGANDLVAVCQVFVDYSISDDGAGGQEWIREDVDDDSSQPVNFRCTSCQTFFENFELDSNGYLIALSK